MILHRLTFSYRHRILIEKLTIQSPFRYEAIFQNEGCFVYVSGAGIQLHSAEDKVLVKQEEAVLLKCGTYFVDFLKRSEEEVVEVFAIHLYQEVLQELYKRELPELIKQRIQGARIQKMIPDHTIAKFIESLDFYFQHPSLVNDDLLELKIKELMLLLIQSNNAASVLQLLEDLFTPSVVHIKDVVHLHLFSNLSVEELARLCNMSLSAFKRAFKKIFNDTPAQYINAERIKKAAELLKTSDLSISDIAYETGFNDPAYFARLFKHKTGFAPTDFRQQHALNQKSF